MKNETVQTGLRIPISRYEELKVAAERAGVSVNSLVLMLVEVGLSVVSLGVEEAGHISPHGLPHSGE